MLDEEHYESQGCGGVDVWELDLGRSRVLSKDKYKRLNVKTCKNGVVEFKFVYIFEPSFLNGT